MKTLPTDQRITRFDTQDGTTISLDPKLLMVPSDPVVAIDNGSLWQKIALLGELAGNPALAIQRSLNYLAELPRGKSRVKPSRQSAVKGNVEITYRGKTYTSDRKGASLNAQSGLHGDKTDNLKLRVILALEQLGLGNGEDIHLSLSLFFTPGNFKAQETAAKKALSQSLTWSTPQGRKSATIQTLQVVPEGYHLGCYRQLAIAESKPHDCWQACYDIGYRTLLCDFIDPDGFFDDNRSQSYDGKGTSLYYSWVAEEAGIENAEDPQFITAVNNCEDYYQPQGEPEPIPIADAIDTAHEWYIGEIAEIITDCTPPEIETSIVGGGGAFRFGRDLIPSLRGSDRYVVEHPDLANVIAQTITLAQEL